MPLAPIFVIAARRRSVDFGNAERVDRESAGNDVAVRVAGRGDAEGLAIRRGEILAGVAVDAAQTGEQARVQDEVAAVGRIDLREALADVGVEHRIAVAAEAEVGQRRLGQRLPVSSS